MSPLSRTLATAAAAALLALGGAGGAAADTITLNGASQFDEDHAFTKTMRKFEELVKEYYQGPEELEFILTSIASWASRRTTSPT